MKKEIWVLFSVALLLFFGGVAEAQMKANSLCLNGGSGYKVGGGSVMWTYPNFGVCKYFPTYAHIPATSLNNQGTVYPWKIVGWGWTGMTVAGGGDTWYWETCLMKSKDNPYQTTMSFDYPMLFATGVVPHTGFPMPIYGGLVPTTVPDVGGNRFQYPSSMGGFDGYMNIFATYAGTFMVPSSQPDTAYTFSIIGDCTTGSVITLPSNYSIWEVLWCKKGPVGHYAVFSCEGDCNQTWWAGQKGRNYSIMMDNDGGYIWYWTNGCDGTGEEMDMGLYLCDAITIPVNIPGAYWGQPYTGYGFDVGATCLTPYLSSGNLQLGFMSMDYAGDQQYRFIMAAFKIPGVTIGPYKSGYRLPHGWDIFTNLFLSIIPVFQHQLKQGYPSSMFGTTAGGHTTFLPFPPDPILIGLEVVYSSLPTQLKYPPSAGFTVVYF
jgi:hypothetical protein